MIAADVIRFYRPTTRTHPNCCYYDAASNEFHAFSPAILCEQARAALETVPMMTMWWLVGWLVGRLVVSVAIFVVAHRSPGFHERSELAKVEQGMGQRRPWRRHGRFFAGRLVLDWFCGPATSRGWVGLAMRRRGWLAGWLAGATHRVPLTKSPLVCVRGRTCTHFTYTHVLVFGGHGRNWTS